MRKRRKRLILITFFSIMSIGINYMALGTNKCNLEIVLGSRHNYLFENMFSGMFSGREIGYNGYIILP